MFDIYELGAYASSIPEKFKEIDTIIHSQIQMAILQF